MKKVLIWSYAAIVLILCSCSDDIAVKPPPPDPCAGKKPVSADFEIYEPRSPGRITKFWVQYDTDTSFSTDAIFKAVERNADSYEWEIGADILTTKDVVRQNFPRGKKIPIRLIVRKKPDTLCFPADDGIDTITRYLYVVKLNEENREYSSPLEGKFIGRYDDTPNESQTITVNPYYSRAGSFWVWQLAIYDFPKIGCNMIDFPTWIGYKQREFFFENSSNECKAPGGIIYVHGKNNDSVLIHYAEFLPLRPKGAPGPVRIFRGVRIQ